MSLKKWQLSLSPSEKDKDRRLLKLKIDEKELMALINSVQGAVGRPFILENDEFDFGFYIYEPKKEEIDTLIETLKTKCPEGGMPAQERKQNILSSERPQDEGLGDLLDKVAKGLNNLMDEVRTNNANRQLDENRDQDPKSTEKATDQQKEKQAQKSQAENGMPVKPEAASPAQKQAEEKAEKQVVSEPPRAEAVRPTPAEPPVHELADILYSGSDGNSGFLDLELNSRYTFEEFVIGPNNRFTAAAAQAVADNPGKIYNPFFIYGGVGLGKTHMMHAVGHYVRRKTPTLKVLYVTTEKFMSEVIDSIRRGQLQKMRDHYRQVDLLLVDDIQFLVESESTQEEFFHTFNVLHQSGKQIIITSDRPPKQLTTLEDRLRSRFEWGLIADIKSPNLETRVAILKKKGELEKLKLDDNMLLYIASKLKSNIRELEGFLKRINAYASLTHQDVNMDLVHSLMSDLLPVEEAEETPVRPAPAQAQPETHPQEYVIKSQTTVTQPPVPIAAPQPEPKPKSQEAVFQQPVPQPKVAPAPQIQVPLSQEKAQETVSPPSPLKPVIPVVTRLTPQQPKDPAEANLKSVDVAFFFPAGKDEELLKVKDHFRDVIKKHKLKFRLEGIFEQPYEFTAKINYEFFTELCKTNNIGIAIVLGPPMDSTGEAEDFGNLLSTMMDDEKVSLQLVPWTELNKDYRYLNLALDITLLKHKL